MVRRHRQVTGSFQNQVQQVGNSSSCKVFTLFFFAALITYLVSIQTPISCCQSRWADFSPVSPSTCCGMAPSPSLQRRCCSGRSSRWSRCWCQSSACVQRCSISPPTHTPQTHCLPPALWQSQTPCKGKLLLTSFKRNYWSSRTESSRHILTCHKNGRSPGSCNLCQDELFTIISQKSIFRP